jgi:hypothetical protein
MNTAVRIVRGRSQGPSGGGADDVLQHYHHGHRRKGQDEPSFQRFRGQTQSSVHGLAPYLPVFEDLVASAIPAQYV